MAWSKPLDDDEIEFIKTSWPQLSAPEIARRMGRSRRTVDRHLEALGLKARQAPANVGRARVGAEAGGRLAELYELKSILRATLTGDVDPRSIAKVSSEYREVLAEIDALESEELDTLGHAAGAAVVPIRPSPVPLQRTV